MSIKKSLINTLKNWSHQFGIEITKYPPKLPLDFDRDVTETILKVEPFTMTSPERLFALCEAVKYIVVNNIPGDIVECGVWKGGSMMAIADRLLAFKEGDRHLYLFDTFEGMTEPSDRDVDFLGKKASQLLLDNNKQQGDNIWCYAPLEQVKTAVNSIGYQKEKIHFIPGKVEETIPEQAPSTIALLRLDTDWYESTRHELIHLFPRISPGGVIIIDDYGYWQGVRRAVDEYIEENKISLLLNRIDFTGRIGVVLK